MQLMESDLFTMQVPESLSCWFDAEDNLSTNSLFFSSNYGLEGVLEVISGPDHSALPDLCEAAIISEVDSLAGFVDKVDEDYANEIVTIYNDDNGMHSQRHFFRYLDACAIHLVLLANYSEADHIIARKIIESVVIKKKEIRMPVLQRLNFTFEGFAPLDKLGANRYFIANFNEVIGK